MAKTQIIKRRIKSVKNIRQITKAMEMVAASKLRRAQEAATASRMYANTAREVVGQLSLVQQATGNVFFQQRTVKTRLLIIFTSDRGLAGAYNSNILKSVVQILQTEPDLVHKAIVIGQKGAQFLNRLKDKVNIEGVYINWPIRPMVADVAPIVSTAMAKFKSAEVDVATILFTDFISIVKQQVVRRDILPVAPTSGLNRKPAGGADMLFEPSATEALDYILPRFIEAQLYQASLEAIASEQSMRMVAMKNASDNAKDLISDLTLTFNGARQAGITQELAEISAGAQAIN